MAKDLSEKTKNIIGIVAVAVMVLLIIGLRVAWADALQIPIKFHYGYTQDTVDVEIRAFETVVGTFQKTNVASIDTVLSFGDDTIWQVVAYSQVTPDSTATWTYQINRRSSNGPVEWPVTMYWTEGTDSARCRFYKDSTVSLSFLITGKQSFDSSFTVYRDTAYSVINEIYNFGQTNPVSWSWNMLWRRIDTGQIIQAPIANTTTLYGFVKLPNGTAAKGALVTVTRGASANSVTTGLGNVERYAVTTDILSQRTDSLGKFTINVVSSNQFADTANAYYDVKCQWKSIELFNIRHIWAPANTTVNVLDTLAGRL